jgi:hypothetical protein
LLVERGNGAMCVACDWRGPRPDSSDSTDSEESEQTPGEREAVEV